MGKIYVFVNQKGGVGKTISALNIGAFLAGAEKSVLLVDFDAQANLSSGFGVNSAKPGVYELISGMAPIEKTIRNTMVSNPSIIPEGIDLSGAAVALIEQNARELFLRKFLEPVRSQYDYILIDCPLSLGILTLNGLVAADTVLISMQCEYFALEGLSFLLKTIKRIQKKLNSALVIGGIFLPCTIPGPALPRMW